MSFISFRNKHENIWAQIAGVKVWESSKQKLLVVVIDRDYRFIKIVKFNEFSTKKTFTEIVCRSPVCILSIALNVSWQRNKQKDNHIHERSLHIVFRDYNSSFKDLLKNDNCVCIHHRNIQSLAVEPFKVKENLSNTIMSDIFPITVLNYNLRSQTDFLRNTVNTTKLV